MKTLLFFVLLAFALWLIAASRVSRPPRRERPPITQKDLTVVTARVIKVEDWQVENDPAQTVRVATTSQGRFLVNVGVELQPGMEYRLQVYQDAKSDLGVVVFAESTALVYDLAFQLS